MARPFTTQLTARQEKVLTWIKTFIFRNGMPPTVREIGAAFGFNSSSVFDYLKVLERKGYLKRGNLGARSLTLSDDSQVLREVAARRVPILGRVAAGKPILATEDPLGSVAVEAEDVRGAETYALLVQGDSMINAGILDGDIVLIRKQESANDGDIIVGMVDDEATLKRFRKDGKRIKLEPANAAMKPIYVNPEQLKVLGKLVGVQRRYK